MDVNNRSSLIQRLEAHSNHKPVVRPPLRTQLQWLDWPPRPFSIQVIQRLPTIINRSKMAKVLKHRHRHRSSLNIQLRPLHYRKVGLPILIRIRASTIISTWQRKPHNGSSPRDQTPLLLSKRHSLPPPRHTGTLLHHQCSRSRTWHLLCFHRILRRLGTPKVS